MNSSLKEGKHFTAPCSYNAFSLLQDLVVLAEGSQEDEGGDIFETVNPLPTLGFLASHVHDPGRRQERETIREQAGRSFPIFTDLGLLSLTPGSPEVVEKRCCARQSAVSLFPEQGDASPQRDLVEGESVVMDACGGESDPQHVLLCRDVLGHSDAFQVTHVAKRA